MRLRREYILEKLDLQYWWNKDKSRSEITLSCGRWSVCNQTRSTDPREITEMISDALIEIQHRLKEEEENDYRETRWTED